MKTKTISQNITSGLLFMVFFLVTGFSLYLSNELTWPALVFSLIKGALSLLFAWFFFLILSDAIVKAIMTSVAHLHEKRKSGGLIFHFIKPGPDEIIPRNERNKEKSKGKTGKRRKTKASHRSFFVKREVFHNATQAIERKSRNVKEKS